MRPRLPNHKGPVAVRVEPVAVAEEVAGAAPAARCRS
jgi:hypothetical protein